MGFSMREFDLICFDVDGTLVEHPENKVIWEVLNIKFTGGDAINVERYNMYHTGEITYSDWVMLDVEGWIKEGATRRQVQEAIEEFRLTEGAEETVRELKRRGYHLAVISGTLDIMIETLFANHPFDIVFTNKVFFDKEGLLTSWEATPFDLDGKPIALRELVGRFGTSLERTAFIGDGENDVPVLGVAGFVVAYNPRSHELERGADVVIKEKNLRKLLEIFP
jgi:phosphoserine phosphatase